MAAQYYYCTQCHKKVSTSQRLFDVLHEFSKSDPENCSACGNPRELHVSLDFQLGLGDGDFQVVHAFHVPSRRDVVFLAGASAGTMAVASAQAINLAFGW